MKTPPSPASSLVTLRERRSPFLALQLVSALVAGILLTLSAAPYTLWWLGPVAFMLLYPGTHRLSVAAAALKGWCFGIGLFGSGTHWVYVSIHDYGMTSAPLAALMTALFVSVLALFPGVTLWFYRRFVNEHHAALGFIGVWGLGEWLRTYLFTGFPWLLAGTSQVDSPLASLAPLGGVFLLSLGVLASGVALAELCLRRRLWPAVIMGIAWLTAAWLPGGWTTPAERQYQVAMVQGNLDQIIKWTPAGRQQAIKTYLERTAALEGSPDLVIWPETALPMLETSARPIMSEAAQGLPEQAALIGGVIQQDDAGQYYNAMIGVGNSSGQYRKEHLVPFGEYLPLDSLLRGLVNFFDLPMSIMTPGSSEVAPMQAAGLTLGNAICYEIIFPHLVANRARDSDVLVTVSNDTWFGASSGPHQHFQMARLRALENGRYVIRATSNGITAIINPEGGIDAIAPQFETATLTGSVTAMQGLTPFTRLGSWPTWGAFLLMTLIAIKRPRKRQQD